MATATLHPSCSVSEFSVDRQHDYQTQEAARLRTTRPKTEPLWRKNDTAARKVGQRGTIYWVGKNIMGEDGKMTGTRTKGASYHGEWNSDKKNGYGVQEYPNGEKYEGQWANGLRDGEGTLWVPVGKAGKLRKLYVGGWKDDKRHGRGTCFLKNGEFYQGVWDNGKMHGHGTLRYANGDMYIGEWHNGLRSGQGTLNKSNGDTYEGYWLNDKREGSGSYFYAESGKVFVGEWANDLPKAGVYTQASANPDQASQVPQTSVLPEIRLAKPSFVLEAAIAVVRDRRRAMRAQATPLSRLFAEDEVESLREAFDGEKSSDGTIKANDLQALCAQLGSSLLLLQVGSTQGSAGSSSSLLQRLLADAGVVQSPLEAEAEPSLTFEDFLRVVALILDEEANLNSETS